MVEDWFNMLDFAIDLIIESKEQRVKGVIGERITILHLDHANELLMKSFLIYKGYVIEYLEKDDVKKGVKNEDVIGKNKTIDYLDCLNLVCKNIEFSNEQKEKIVKFHKIRNEIQHRAKNLPLKKGEEIDLFYPCFKELYTKMFPEYADQFPDLFEVID